MRPVVSLERLPRVQGDRATGTPGDWESLAEQGAANGGTGWGPRLARIIHQLGVQSTQRHSTGVETRHHPHYSWRSDNGKGYGQSRIAMNNAG